MKYEERERQHGEVGGAYVSYFRDAFQKLHKHTQTGYITGHIWRLETATQSLK